MYKVLIVEDDPMVAMINEQYVNRNKDFQVVKKCKNGEEALEYLKEKEIDLIILDVFMPIMDGLETLRHIREKNIEAEAIMVTAANDTATFEGTMHLGVIDFLVKPFAYERFQIALEKFAAKKSALKGATVLNQHNIDSIITHTAKPAEKDYPKGIQEKTLEMIQQHFLSVNGWICGDDIADKVGLSNVTIRRYMNYLVGTGEIEESINYETGGRPCMLYRRAQ